MLTFISWLFSAFLSLTHTLARGDNLLEPQPQTTGPFLSKSRQGRKGCRRNGLGAGRVLGREKGLERVVGGGGEREEQTRAGGGSMGRCSRH